MEIKKENGEYIFSDKREIETKTFPEKDYSKFFQEKNIMKVEFLNLCSIQLQKKYWDAGKEAYVPTAEKELYEGEHVYIFTQKLPEKLGLEQKRCCALRMSGEDVKIQTFNASPFFLDVCTYFFLQTKKEKINRQINLLVNPSKVENWSGMSTYRHTRLITFREEEIYGENFYSNIRQLAYIRTTEKNRIHIDTGIYYLCDLDKILYAHLNG